MDSGHIPRNMRRSSIVAINANSASIINLLSTGIVGRAGMLGIIAIFQIANRNAFKLETCKNIDCPISSLRKSTLAITVGSKFVLSFLPPCEEREKIFVCY